MPSEDVGSSGRGTSHVCKACGSPAQLVDDGRRAACPDCGNDWNIGPDPCERCNDKGWIWVVKTDAPCPDCTPYPGPGKDRLVTDGGRDRLDRETTQQLSDKMSSLAKQALTGGLGMGSSVTAFGFGANELAAVAGFIGIWMLYRSFMTADDLSREVSALA